MILTTLECKKWVVVIATARLEKKKPTITYTFILELKCMDSWGDGRKLSFPFRKSLKRHLGSCRLNHKESSQQVLSVWFLTSHPGNTTHLETASGILS